MHETNEVDDMKQPSRLVYAARGIISALKNMGAGFAEDNKGLEQGSREDRIVAITKIPDYVPEDL
jgi:hypothetical protein